MQAQQSYRAHRGRAGSMESGAAMRDGSRGAQRDMTAETLPLVLRLPQPPTRMQRRDLSHESRTTGGRRGCQPRQRAE